MLLSNIWKPSLIALLVALALIALYPPEERLKPGIDLAGGTTLVYEVNVPEGQDADEAIEQVIATLRKRIDPQGIRNLVWRQQAGNRLEIQMALPPAETVERRQAYLDAREALFTDTITQAAVNDLLRATGDKQQALLDQLSQRHPALEGQLAELVEAKQELEAARGPYLESQQAYRAARAALDGLPPDDAQQRPALLEDVKAAQKELEAFTREFVRARRAFQRIEQKVLSAKLDASDFDQALIMSDSVGSQEMEEAKEAGEDPEEVLSPRDQAIAELVRQYPDKADEINAAYAAYEAYEEVKGPLDDPNDLKALLRGSGVLEFRIAPSAQEVPDVGKYREQLDERGPRAGLDEPYVWFEVDDIEQFAEEEEEQEAVARDAEGYFRGRGMIGAEYGGNYYLLLSNSPGSSLTQRDPDWELSSVSRTVDQMGLPAVGFAMNSVGAQLMGALTGGNLQEPMAIVLDGRVISAPVVQGRISSQGVINGGRGGFSQDEMEYLIRTLGAGSLSARLSEEPISEKTIGPSLGKENLNAGLQAAIGALIVVAIFVAIYYLFLGLVADFALLLNMIFVLGVMATLQATFTLPGIAGIVLTIGMAVDANVLIFERIREEMNEGRDLKAAVRLGYDKALSTILDANITTLITCLVLGYTATAEVKGFAVTLGIGIVASVFTALFVSRVIVEYYLSLAKPKTINMLPTLIPGLQKALRPNIDWLAKRKLYVGVSSILMITGLTLVGIRGPEMFDIEFRSGTQVGIEFKEGARLSAQEVEERLDQAAEQSGLERLAGTDANVVTVGEVVDGKAAEFNIATLETDTPQITEAIKAAFSDVLDTTRPIDFAGVDASQLGTAPVYPVRSGELAEVIDQPGLDENVSEYLGGVAIVLNDLSPAASLEDLEDRIQRMRLQPQYENLTGREYEVIGLERAIVDDASPGDAPVYASAVVVSRDNDTNYVENPDAFTTPGGLAATEWSLVRDALQRDTSLASVSNFSAQVSQTMQQQAIAALVLSLLAVVAYIWLRFGTLRYGLAAIVALVHDILITLGLVAICGFLYDAGMGDNVLLLDPFKIDLALVAALLTIIGYSLNDTIVVFDRIRENRGRLPHATEQIINQSINQTISRTILTSTTTLLALLVLYIFGGDGVHGFAFAMIMGVFVGTYSSIAIASPILLFGGGAKAIEQDAERKRQREEQIAEEQRLAGN